MPKNDDNTPVALSSSVGGHGWDARYRRASAEATKAAVDDRGRVRPLVRSGRSARGMCVRCVHWRDVRLAGSQGARSVGWRGPESADPATLAFVAVGD